MPVPAGDLTITDSRTLQRAGSPTTVATHATRNYIGPLKGTREQGLGRVVEVGENTTPDSYPVEWFACGAEGI